MVGECAKPFVMSLLLDALSLAAVCSLSAFPSISDDLDSRYVQLVYTVPSIDSTGSLCLWHTGTGTFKFQYFGMNVYTVPGIQT